MLPGNAQLLKKDRPPALDIPNNDTTPLIVEHPTVHVSTVDQDPQPDQDLSLSRPTSTTSSLDPYYFGIRSPSDSPVPPLPTGPIPAAITPDHSPPQEPVTPARDPAAIDRRGLVGVGELTTPRWTRAEKSADQNQDHDPAFPSSISEEYQVVIPEDVIQDEPDSPWTIEAVDSESSEKDDVLDVKIPSRPLRTRPSVADESGGEEILYPRKAVSPVPDLPTQSQALTEVSPPDPLPQTDPSSPSGGPSPTLSPPSSFSQSTRRAKKRTSDEFEMDQFGTLTSKRASASALAKSKDDKIEKGSVRKHRSLNVSTSSAGSLSKAKERRRESVGLTVSSGAKASPASTKVPDRHIRQSSAGLTPSNTDSFAQRRVHTTDFSHLPPSPSSSSIRQFLRHTASSGSSQTPPLSTSASKEGSSIAHSGSNVAHSLLRGTQEGWSGLDDEATAEALRKLDGVSGKAARARASIGSFGRPSSSSRPGTPAGKAPGQWEGVGSESSKIKRIRDSLSATRDKEDQHTVSNANSATADYLTDMILSTAPLTSSDEHSSGVPITDKTPKKLTSTTTRSSMTPKRGSTSSTTYTSTPSSRDSASLSAATSVTSVSATSGRISGGKVRRNSAGSDISSAHSNDAILHKDRVASLALTGEALDDGVVPPVPPLPKNLSNYRSPPSTSSGAAFPSSSVPEDKEKQLSNEAELNRATAVEVSSTTSAPPSASSVSQARRASQHYSSEHTSMHSAPESSPAVTKTPSKKWSFSSALNLKISGSPSTSGQKSGFPLSPRAVTFGQQLRKSISREHGVSASGTSSKYQWDPKQPDAMISAGSLGSFSSVGSIRSPVPAVIPPKTPDRVGIPSRSGTNSSASTTNTTSALSAPQPGPLSPGASIRRNQSKRLTPSSIPFFRRSSSQSMQLSLPPTIGKPSSPTLLSTQLAQHRQKSSASPSKDQYDSAASTSAPGSSSHRKSSVLSLGLPSLLKGSSSRRSLHSDSKESSREASKAKDSTKEAERDRTRPEKAEKEKQKKDEKDRSESRISVLIGGRKRGKTLSSTEPKRPKSPVSMPPMQMSALEPATAQRVARLKPSTSGSTSTTQSTATRTVSSSRLMSQTVSSLQKQSDASLRSRTQLPTIAGSPSVVTNGTASTQTLKESIKEPKEPPLSSLNTALGYPKETPTKIPRISSRTSTTASPPLKNSGSSLSTRRMSVNVSGLAISSRRSSPSNMSATEFGVKENGDTVTPKTVSATATTSLSNLNRKTNRDSITFGGLRKASASSVASTSTPAVPQETSHHRFSALSPSRGLKLLSPKISLSSRTSHSASAQNVHHATGSSSSSRQSLSTPSPVPSSVDEDEILGDEEMMHYIKRQHAKKLANGANQHELDELLRFPEPSPPTPPMSPPSVLKSQSQHLSGYERKEILDYPSVYYFGSGSKKKMATLDASANNYGYDDDRGDYLVVHQDHLGYRYQILDTLGKGSFGQVLQCRDHRTGEAVAIKIIRNKKRFHHQALVEIKILDSLRKWDDEDKHHVIKMTEYFYFRNHLCIAMELLSINLYELIKANGFVGFTTALIRRFTNQMLMSLCLMRDHRIVHCDLKPENVLLRHPAKSAIKVIDFGSSCFENEKIYTYIQSRFYRSPEVILGMNYHMAIDMWSLGCILAELYTGFPIFPGENEQEQLSCIMEVLGVPDKEFVNRSSRKKLFFDPSGTPRAFVNSKGRRRRPGTKTLAQVLRCNDEDFVDFIAKCLVWDPDRRLKPASALRHPFITAGRKPKPSSSISKPSSSLLGSRSKQLTETPKKSLISAPTPLTARSSRTAVTATGPTTPSSSHASTLGSSTRPYRTSQAQGLASYHSSRTLNGVTSSVTK